MARWALYPSLVPLARLKELVGIVKLQPPLNDYYGISLDFAERFHLCPGGRHAGVDYALHRIRGGHHEWLEPVLYAVTDGWIEKRGFLADGTGYLTLRVDTGYHDEPMWVIHYHVRDTLLDVGARVAAGDAIGRMTRGAEGSLSTGHHLHLQLTYGQKSWQYAVNPHPYGLPGRPPR